MNKMVVDVFCGEFNYERPKHFETLDSEILFFFPMDPPVIPRIRARFEEDYVQWGG